MTSGPRKPKGRVPGCTARSRNRPSNPQVWWAQSPPSPEGPYTRNPTCLGTNKQKGQGGGRGARGPFPQMQKAQKQRSRAGRDFLVNCSEVLSAGQSSMHPPGTCFPNLPILLGKINPDMAGEWGGWYLTPQAALSLQAGRLGPLPAKTAWGRIACSTPASVNTDMGPSGPEIWPQDARALVSPPSPLGTATSQGLANSASTRGKEEETLSVVSYSKCVWGGYPSLSIVEGPLSTLSSLPSSSNHRFSPCRCDQGSKPTQIQTHPSLAIPCPPEFASTLQINPCANGWP